MDYIAGRPHVERIGEHGLFTDEGEPVVLQKVQKEVAEHKGVVWPHVISLRWEDAARLGYDSANLRWYAAFHNESHHPHVHLMVYSAKDRSGIFQSPEIETSMLELSKRLQHTGGKSLWLFETGCQESG